MSIDPPQPLPNQKADDCLSRTLEGTAFSVALGSFLGALRSNWQDMAEETTSKGYLALQKTGGSMLRYGIYLGGVGILYCSMECFIEKLREKEDYVNGFCGGLAAGLAVGMKSRSPGVGVASGLAMGVVSTIVDATNHSIKGESLIPPDILTPRKKFAPTVRIEETQTPPPTL